MSKKTFIHAENNNKILSSNEVKLYVPPEPEKMKVIIWGKELCNMAEWNDFLKCVEEKTEENNQLKQQLAEKDKEIERLKNLFKLNNEVVINQGKEIFDLRVQILQQKQNQTQLAIQELAEIERLLYESHYKEIDNKYYAEYEDINSLIDSRIKALEELKGE